MLEGGWGEVEKTGDCSSTRWVWLNTTGVIVMEVGNMSHPSHRQVKSTERTLLPVVKLGLMILDVGIYMRLPGVELSSEPSRLLSMALACRNSVYSDFSSHCYLPKVTLGWRIYG